jgi:hypothetical protein
LDEDDNPDEGEVTLSSDAELQCTKSGEVLLDYPDGVSTFDITSRRAQELAAKRDALWSRSTQDGLAAARRLCGYRSAQESPDVTVLGSISTDSVDGLDWRGEIDKLILKREGEVVVPGLLFRPTEARGRRPAVIIASSKGAQAATDPAGLCSQLARDGHLVLAIDVRGYGETRAAGQRQRDRYFGSDFKTSLLALHLNRPLLGQRAEDMQAAINYLVTRHDVDPDNIKLVGEGNCGPPAIHLAAFDHRIKTLTLVSSIESWMDVVNEPFAVDQLSNVVPSALEYYDLPNLIAAIAPRTVVIESPVNPKG